MSLIEAALSSNLAALDRRIRAAAARAGRSADEVTLIVVTKYAPDAAVLVSDADGRFEIDALPPGTWRVEVASYGYVTERFEISLPHRGELRGVRIDLLPVRERVFHIYRDVALGLLPSPGLWGVWTPREIFDHVRSRRPAG